MTDREFRVYHKELKSYAENLIRLLRIKEGLTIDGISPDDLVSEAIMHNCYDLESAKKPMQTYLFNESRREKGRRQAGGISKDYQKKCKTCTKFKTANEFTIIYREGINYTYLKSDCKKCYAEKAKKYRKNNPLTEEQKLKSKLRGQRYRNRQKALT